MVVTQGRPDLPETPAIRDKRERSREPGMLSRVYFHQPCIRCQAKRRLKGGSNRHQRCLDPGDHLCRQQSKGHECRENLGTNQPWTYIEDSRV